MTREINRLIEMGERNPRLRLRQVDKSRSSPRKRGVILHLLNDAWSDNWGFVPLTESEIAYAGKKLKPIIYDELVWIAEYDGEPVAFMITLPDINELIRDLDGELFPFGWAKLLWRLRKPRTRRARVPLMGVAKKLHGTRLASQLAFMLIEFTRREVVGKFGVEIGEFGWILEDNKGMLSIAELPGAQDQSPLPDFREGALARTPPMSAHGPTLSPRPAPICRRRRPCRRSAASGEHSRWSSRKPRSRCQQPAV